MVVLYSSNPPCPKCKELKEKLNSSQIQYTVCDEINKVYSAMDKLNTDFVPILQVDEQYMDYNTSIKWIGETINEQQ